MPILQSSKVPVIIPISGGERVVVEKRNCLEDIVVQDDEGSVLERINSALAPLAKQLDADG